MAHLRAYVAAVAIFGMIPGAGEVIENVIHLLREGHTAHALDDEGHERHGSEHGCTGTAHVCSCCPSPAFMRVQLVTRVDRSPPTDHTMLPAVAQPTADAHLGRLFRPPIA